MPTYSYTAKSFDGKDQNGKLFAQDIHQLAQVLRNQNILLIKAETASETKASKLIFFLPSMGVSSTEKLLMVRNLWIMFSAGLSLPRIFDILSVQAKKKKLKNIMIDINGRLSKGETFSDALSIYPDVFNEFFRNMIKIGEEAGNLEDIFAILSEHMDRDHELRSKIRGALIYPCIIGITMVIIGMVISTFVLPQFSSFLVGMNIPLPIYTRILIFISETSQKYWYLTIIGILVAAYLAFLSVKTKTGKLVKDTILIKMPLLSPFIKKTNSAILIRSLSSLNSSGIPIIRSMEITSATVGNIYYKRALNEAMERIKKGDKLSDALRPHANIFPLGTIDMMEVGEETGKTSVVLKKLAEFYEQEVIEITKNFSSIIEPLLIIFLGAVVAFFAISIIAPMYSSLNSI